MRKIVPQIIIYYILKKYWKIIAVTLAIIGVIILFLLFAAMPSSIVKTGTGAVPTATIEHIDTINLGDRIIISINITAQDSDNDIRVIEVLIQSSQATKLARDYDGNTINITTMSPFFHTPYGSDVDPAINPFSKVIAIDLDEDIILTIFLAVTDNGGNIILEEITVGEPKTINFPFLITLVSMIILYIRKRKWID